MAARKIAWTGAMSIESKLAELGIVLPEPAAPVAAYVPVVVHGGMAHVSGQLPFIDGQLVTGRLGEDVALEQGAAAARASSSVSHWKLIMVLMRLPSRRTP